MVVGIGCIPVVFMAHRRTPLNRIAIAVGGTLIAFWAPTGGVSATPHMKGAVREPEDLGEQVVRLFDQLDRMSRDIESVRADIATVSERISELSRRIEVQQRLLNQRASEAYMAGRAGQINSMLGARSFTDLVDALEYLDAVSQKDHDVLLSLQHRKDEVELQRARLGALEEELRARRARLEATASDLVERLESQVLVRPGDERSAPNAPIGSSPSPPALPSLSPPSSASGREAVTMLIRDWFATLGSRTVEVALCVAEAESGLDPLAVNPATGAAGLFQFLPSTWESLSGTAGWTAASVFDARANAAVAAWTVARYGWHPWRSIAADCGA